MHAIVLTWKAKGQLEGIRSSLPRSGFEGLNSGCQTWWHHAESHLTGLNY